MPIRPLTGIYIVINDQKRFVGKVGVCPHVRLPDYLSGRVIFYKAEPFEKAYSYTLKAISTDRAAWNKGRTLGAEYLVIYCADTRELLVVPAETIDAIAFDKSLGEGLQIRVPEDNVMRYAAEGEIRMGYTRPENDIVLAPARAVEKPKASNTDQGSLF